MTNDEIVKALRKNADENTCRCTCEECDEDDCLTPVFRAAADLIEQQAARIEELEKAVAVFGQANKKLREKVPEWISVEDADRRPSPGKRVIATDGVFVGEAYRTSADTWRRYDGVAMRDCLSSVVTHWMPLPEGLKEET